MIDNCIEIRVRYADTDQMKVAYYSQYLIWFECGRTELLREIGYPYSRLEAEGIILPVIEAWCQYHKPARYDEVLTVRTTLPNLPRVKLRLDYQIFRSEPHEMLARGYTVHAFLNSEGHPVRPPKAFLEILKSYFETN
ncbi:acyl-CoA thioesterase [candidate division KSB1 bacterium]|nr:MAG: acyl-CoA thioesterase [candidate division KSB1 bacterium]RKY86574.1 MAG: acyl-CoA thioesterase [candidate division KSB1 bacterium]HDI52103.1 acyl-CoA thioesterase [Bacteroidota bacterium]